METLIYIDEKDKYDASAVANTFANEDTRNRAYFNTLGAKLALKYLASEGINVPNVYNIHSIKKIIEDIDISDVRLPNINIDVRIIFDENIIFIPKSHFEYDITPDIYLIFNLAQDFSNVKFLGFVEPKLINKNNENKDYYFIEKEKLNSPVDLKNYIENFQKEVSENISSEEIENSERIIISMADNDISEDDKKYLLRQLARSVELRDKIIEYENFETISYKVLSDTSVQKRGIPLAIDELENFDSQNDFSDNTLSQDFIEEETNSLITESVELPIDSEEQSGENIVQNDFIDAVEENLSMDNMEFPPEGILDSTTIDDTVISLDNVETTEKVIDEIQNDSSVETISLDNIEIPVEQVSENEGQDNIISLEDITVPENSTIDTIDDIETISIDDIKLSTENLEGNADFVGETVNFDNIELPTIEAEHSENAESKIDLENLEELTIDNNSSGNLNEAINEQEHINFEDLSTDSSELPNILAEGNPEQNVDANFDLIDDIKIPNDELQENTLSINTDITDNNLPDETADDTEFEELVNLGENAETSDSFGKNLLDNLNEENIDNIEIDTTQTSIDSRNISSDDLLEQIDNILTTNAQIDDNVEETTQDENITVDTIEEYFNEEPNSSDDNSETSDLEMLFNDTDTDNDIDSIEENIQEETEQTIPGAALLKTEKTKPDKKIIMLMAALIGVIIAISAVTFLKPKTSQNVEPITPKELNTPSEITDTPIMPQNTELNTMETNTPNINSTEIKNVAKAQPQEIKNNPAPKKQTTESYLSVNKLVWDVPAEISANPQMQTYLKTAGKSIKLSLSADLLLANEYAYTNQIKVGLLINADGNVQNANILASSGSTQIDNIVLQSVKETLNVIKPSSGAVKTPDFKLTLIIYL